MGSGAAYRTLDMELLFCKEADRQVERPVDMLTSRHAARPAKKYTGIISRQVSMLGRAEPREKSNLGYEGPIDTRTYVSHKQRAHGWHRRTGPVFFFFFGGGGGG